MELLGADERIRLGQVLTQSVALPRVPAALLGESDLMCPGCHGQDGYACGPDTVFFGYQLDLMIPGSSPR